MEIDFNKYADGLVPVIVQDYRTQKVLMLGFMNAEALMLTKDTGRVTFFSRSRQKLWTKGETSGNFLTVESISPDCDRDTLLIKTTPSGPVCHTGTDTCFDEKNEYADFLFTLEGIVKDRKENPTDSSYTASLFKKGINKIAQKVGEEAVEVVIEAKDNNDDLFKNESADLLFHLLILFREKNISLAEILETLKKRHQAE